jgi:hypothetical protein
MESFPSESGRAGGEFICCTSPAATRQSLSVRNPPRPFLNPKCCARSFSRVGRSALAESQYGAGGARLAGIVPLSAVLAELHRRQRKATRNIDKAMRGIADALD